MIDVKRIDGGDIFYIDLNGEIIEIHATDLAELQRQLTALLAPEAYRILDDQRATLFRDLSLDFHPASGNGVEAAAEEVLAFLRRIKLEWFGHGLTESAPYRWVLDIDLKIPYLEFQREFTYAVKTYADSSDSPIISSLFRRADNKIHTTVIFVLITQAERDRLKQRGSKS